MIFYTVLVVISTLVFKNFQRDHAMQEFILDVIEEGVQISGIHCPINPVLVIGLQGHANLIFINI